jgi:diguanylate cyclase (GGDEF)-like protein
MRLEADGPEPGWDEVDQTSGLTSRLILAYAEREGGPAAADEILRLCGLAERARDLRDERFWFDFETKVRLFEAAAQVLGDPDVSRHIGAAAVDIGVFFGLKLAMRAVGSPRLVYGAVPSHGFKFTTAHRFEQLHLSRGHVRLEYSDISGVGYRECDCQYNIGMLQTITGMFGKPPAAVDHPHCALKGASSCIYDVHWEEGGSFARSLTGWAALSAVAFAATAVAVPSLTAAAAAVPAAGAVIAGRRAIMARHRARHGLETELRDQKELAERLTASLRDLVSELRIDELLSKVIANAQDALPAREFAILLSLGDGLHCRSSSRVSDGSLKLLERWASHVPQALETEINIEDVRAVPELSELALNCASPLGALHSMPLRFRGSRLGLLVALARGSERLVAHERRMLAAYADQAALALGNARLFAELEEAARHDALTGLLNRREFHNVLARQLTQAEHFGHPLGIVMFDLDGFKQVNDEGGHAHGDEVLRGVAEALERTCGRAGDAFRIGGDEFALVLPNRSEEDGRAIADAAVVAIEGLRAGVSACYGLAVWPDGGRTESMLLFNADRALYERKSSRSGDAARAFPARAIRHAARDDASDHHVKTLTRALARTVDAKDSYTRSHCETVSELCGRIAVKLGLAEEHVSKIALAGLLHDVGKIGIPDAILQKPTRLTDEEFEEMKRHSTLGATIVAGAELEEQANWILHHHERPDGRGYPDGLAGDEIPLESRIILVADAFEAITADRPYRRGRPIPDALAEIERHSGTQFEPRCVAALRACLGTGARELFETGRDPIDYSELPSPSFGDAPARRE